MAVKSRLVSRIGSVFKRNLRSARSFLSTLQPNNVTFCIILPLLGFTWSFHQPLSHNTLVLGVILYIISGVGITAGYHRLWSHRSFTASPPLSVFLALAGASSVQGSILNWCQNHRAHHRYVDTPKDPYNVNKGIWWSHMGWLIFKPDPNLKGHVEMSDLLKENVVMWQHNNFPFLCLFTSYALPFVIAKYGWNDGLGGLLYAGIIRVFLFQQATNCVNSLAHWLGDQPYADANSPRDHIITALVTFGEGYHNFHHEFPSDYRNGIRWFDYDPTKWFISLWGWMGFASHLQEFESNEINKAIFQQKWKQVEKLKRQINWGTPLDVLPVYSWPEYQALCVSHGGSKDLVCIAGVIYDVKPFIDSHPGGRTLIQAHVGKDATASFHGGVYRHSKAASNLLDNMRFGVVRGGGQVEAHEQNARPLSSEMADGAAGVP